MDSLVQQETHIYTERLAGEWLSDARRLAVLAKLDVPPDQAALVCKAAAVAVWGDACAKLQGSAARDSWSIRQVATLHAKAYGKARRMPLDLWEQLIGEGVAPALASEREGEVDDEAPSEEEDDEELAAMIRNIERDAESDTARALAALADFDVTSSQLELLGWEYLDRGHQDVLGDAFIKWARERLKAGPVTDDGGVTRERVQHRWRTEG